VQWSDTAPLALSFKEIPHGSGRHRHDETGRTQQRLDGIRARTSQLNEAMSHKWRLTDEQVLRLRVALVPLAQRLAGPQTSGSANHAMSDALHRRILLSCGTGFKYWARHVPLQHMHSTPQGMCQMGELMAQQTLPSTRQTSKEHAALAARQPLEVRLEPWVCRYDEVS
jgi:hypothetical protein